MRSAGSTYLGPRSVVADGSHSDVCPGGGQDRMVSVGRHICVAFMGFVLLSPGGCI